MRVSGGSKSKVSYGFWVGLGVLLAFALWQLVTRLMAEVAGGQDG